SLPALQRAPGAAAGAERHDRRRRRAAACERAQPRGGAAVAAAALGFPGARFRRRRRDALAAALRDGRARAVRHGGGMAQVMQLFWHFLLLGCVAVGGVSTVMPDMYRYVVDENAMVTGRQFSDLYALAQAAPGPNALCVPLRLLAAGAAAGMGGLI